LNVEQCAQVDVLVAQSREFLRRQRVRDEVLLQREVLLVQRPLRREVRADPHERLARQLHRALQRIKHDRRRLSNPFEIAKSRVREHEDDRQQAEERETRERGRASMKERRRIGGDVAHVSTAGPSQGTDTPPLGAASAASVGAVSS
jgi:hypothetical protein